MTKIKNLTKETKKILNKTCACCGRKIKVILSSSPFRKGGLRGISYRGGHYFGKIPLCSRKEEAKAVKAGFRPWRFGKTTLFVYKKDPKPYAFAEYWECPMCYWGKKK